MLELPPLIRSRTNSTVIQRVSTYGLSVSIGGGDGWYPSSSSSCSSNNNSSTALNSPLELHHPQLPSTGTASPSVSRSTSPMPSASKPLYGSPRKGKERALDDVDECSYKVGKTSLDLSETMTPRLELTREVILHKLTKKDTLASVCLEYGISAQALRSSNRLWANDSIHLRPSLKIPLDQCHLPSSSTIERVERRIRPNADTLLLDGEAVAGGGNDLVLWERRKEHTPSHAGAMPTGDLLGIYGVGDEGAGGHCSSRSSLDSFRDPRPSLSGGIAGVSSRLNSASTSSLIDYSPITRTISPAPSTYFDLPSTAALSSSTTVPLRQEDDAVNTYMPSTNNLYSFSSSITSPNSAFSTTTIKGPQYLRQQQMRHGLLGQASDAEWSGSKAYFSVTPSTSVAAPPSTASSSSMSDDDFSHSASASSPPSSTASTSTLHHRLSKQHLRDRRSMHQLAEVDRDNESSSGQAALSQRILQISLLPASELSFFPPPTTTSVAFASMLSPNAASSSSSSSTASLSSSSLSTSAFMSGDAHRHFGQNDAARERAAATGVGAGAGSGSGSAGFSSYPGINNVQRKSSSGSTSTYSMHSVGSSTSTLRAAAEGKAGSSMSGWSMDYFGGEECI